MAKILNIQNKPDKKFLGRKTKKVDLKQFTRGEADKLIRKMRKTMEDAGGIGLSANQIGLDMRVFVAQWEGKFYAVFNPEIEKPSKDKESIEEGCLSIPGQYGHVERSARVTLSGLNKGGKPIKVRA